MSEKEQEKEAEKLRRKFKRLQERARETLEGEDRPGIGQRLLREILPAAALVGMGGMGGYGLRDAQAPVAAPAAPAQATQQTLTSEQTARLALAGQQWADYRADFSEINRQYRAGELSMDEAAGHAERLRRERRRIEADYQAALAEISAP